MTGTECNGESCCTSILVPGGSFPMGRDTETCSGCLDGCPYQACSSDEQPEHPATVSSFYLDKYEVTVGRFRAFMDAFDAGWRPSQGAGANLAVESAQGLAADTTGWQSAWDNELPSTGYQVAAGDNSLEEHITCYSSPQTTWTNPAAGNETYPMNCANWFEAFAFCVWDGGRLPTEAEWEYAAAGGNENRVFPWRNEVTEPLPANYLETDNSPFVAAGSYPAGNGRWGHSDLAGSMFEWVLDWYASDWHTTTQTGCADCANLTGDGTRVRRGGCWVNDAVLLRAVVRSYLNASPTDHGTGVGLRCARSAP
jgi:sulfatase modifying factor 1